MPQTSDLLAESTIPTPVLRRGESTASRESMPALTGIRLFAAMYVVFFHSHLPTALDQHHFSSAATFIRNGLMAVPLFFILSGFILSYTYQGKIARPSGICRFWEARFARIWPLYAASLLLSTLCTHTTPSSLPRSLATLLMVQAWNPFDMGMAGSWNFVCWTLSAEALFYLVFPFLQLSLERQRLRLILFVLIIVQALAIGFATGGINYEDTRGIHDIPLAAVHLPEFIIGVCAGNLFLRRQAICRRAKNIAPPIVPGRGILTYLATLVSLWLLCHSAHSWTAWTALSFAVLLFSLAAEGSALRWLLSTRTLLIGGQISYGIYLLQWPCKVEVNWLCDKANIHSMPQRFVIDCAALLLISALGFYVVEEPARRLIRSLFEQLQAIVPSYRPSRRHA